jgi:hypothetical protein
MICASIWKKQWVHTKYNGINWSWKKKKICE